MLMEPSFPFLRTGLIFTLSAAVQFFPVEVYPVAAPVALAAGLFTYMVTRTIVSGNNITAPAHIMSLPPALPPALPAAASWGLCLSPLSGQLVTCLPFLGTRCISRSHS